MSTIEIPKSDWLHFLDDFSKLHEEVHATVQALGADIGAQTETQGLPFGGISYDESGSAKGSITLFLGTEPDDHIEHRISDPIRLWLSSAADSAQDALEIEGADGTKTILQFDVPELLPNT